ncbi:MAG: HAMP domain-containing protein [Candidatus Omnitrophota bacterium]
MDKNIKFSIRFKIVLFFSILFVSLAILIESINFYGVPFTDIKGINRYIKENAFKEFSIIANMQKAHILDWINEKKQDVTALSEAVRMRELLNEAFILMQSYKEQGKDDDEMLKMLQKEKSYAGLMDDLIFRKKAYADFDELAIMDKDSGIIISSTDQGSIGKKFLDKGFLDNIDKEEVFVDTLSFHGSLDKHLDLVLTHLIRSEDIPSMNSMVLLGSIDIEKIITPIIYNVRGLGNTSEIVMVDKDRKIIMPLKYPLKDGSIAKVFEYKNTGGPAIRVARGEEGIIEDLDYRGVKVLAAYRNLKLSEHETWGMIVKQDRQEVFRYHKDIIIYSVIVLLIGILFAVFLIFVISKNIAGPIKRITEAIKRIENNDFSARAKVNTNDEVGFLATSFNKMISQIEHWKEELEVNIQSRTAELNAANQQLRASEQQLKASNQQLRASQQQLKANNDQLVANDIKLRAEIENREKIEKETKKHLEELQIFFKANMGREEKIIELKNKIRELEVELKKKGE